MARPRTRRPRSATRRSWRRSTARAEPRLAEGLDGVLAVELFALGTIYVDLDGGPHAPMPPPDDPLPRFVALLCAADALPPGLVPADFEGAAVDSGEIVAEVPAPLVEWAAGDAKYFCPRVPGVSSPDQMSRPGRVRMALDGSTGWTLEIADAGSWRRAVGIP
jgi:hypothetical protein